MTLPHSAAAPPAEQDRTAARPAAAQVAVLLALLLGLQPVTTDLYLPALPGLARDLAAPMSATQLTMSALLLSFGLGQLLMGPLSDRWGRRPVLLAGLTLYSLASLAATLAPQVGNLIAARAVQGLGMAAAVVCARAMVRDLYDPHEGAQVMSKGLTGLGMIAFVSPSLGGWLASHGGWRAALAAVTIAGLLTGLTILFKLPETLAQRRPDALRLGPWWQVTVSVARHPGFLSWTALTSFTYGGLFILLAGSSFVYIGRLHLSPWSYGLVMSSGSLSYILGTFVCRRLLVRHGLQDTVAHGALASLLGGLGMLMLGQAEVHWLPAVLLAHWTYLFGHGLLQPCGQTASVGYFPRTAGVASALSGFMLATVAFVTGLWLGASTDGSLRVQGQGLAFFAVLTTATAWLAVRRWGAPPPRS